MTRRTSIRQVRVHAGCEFIWRGYKQRMSAKREVDVQDEIAVLCFDIIRASFSGYL